jgi:N-sulfoglucosamine sulfohydrolase
MEPLNRRQFMLGSAGALAAGLTEGKGERGYRNVILLISDDHSPIAGCYGNSVIRTPNLDRLAASGARFTHAYCTTPSCSASRSAILTGLHNHANGQFGHAHLPYNFHTFPWVQSIPRLLRAQGFATGVIGKLHVNPAEVYPFEYVSPGGEAGGGRDVWGMAEKAREFLARNKDRPFYLHVGYTDPHRAADSSGFANAPSYPRVEARRYSPDDVVVPPFLPDTPEVRRELAEYYRSVDRLDQGIGFMLEALEESGRASETLVIYVSDHGMPFPGAKASPYDSGLHVPFIVRAPGLTEASQVSQAMISLTDILPTVLDWAGAPPPAYSLHGRSLLPILNQERPAGWDAVFTSHTFHEVVNYFPWRGVRTRKYKYTKFLFPELSMPLPSDLWDSPTWQGVRARGLERMGARAVQAVLHHAPEELYDVENDPTESRNLAALPKHASVLEDLRRRVREFREETSDPWLEYFDRIETQPAPLAQGVQAMRARVESGERQLASRAGRAEQG